MKFSLSGCLLFTLTASLAVPKSEYNGYEGFKVFRVKTHGELSAVQEKLSILDYEHWSQDNSNHIDLSLPPDQFEAFELLGLDSHCMHDDLGASILAESKIKSPWKREVNDLSWFDSYHPYADHHQYLQDLQAALPNNSEMVSSGTSYEGRDIFGIHLWGAEGPGKPAILWHGTVHAREWITAMVMEYLTYQLVHGYPTEDLVKAFLDTYDFYIFPFVNPDGFVHTQTTNRLWRKNRQPPPLTAANQSCFGRDVNRQWPFMWDANPEGASPDPCSATYRGETPSDSPENQGLVAFTDKLRDKNGIKLYIDWHSYGQYILSPWGYNCTVYPDDLGQHTKLASLMSEVIRSVANTTFTFGPSCSTLYATTGGSTDYVYGIGEADWSYAIELRDTGHYGFILPPDQILGSAQEQWEGMKVMLSLLNETFFDGQGPVI